MGVWIRVSEVNVGDVTWSWGARGWCERERGTVVICVAYNDK